MSADDHAQQRCRRPDAAAPAGAAGFAAEAYALDRLPDADIMGALRDLPEELRLAVYLADVRGFSYREIAEIMGTPVGTVAARLHAARNRLRHWLAASAARRGLAAAPG